MDHEVIREYYEVWVQSYNTFGEGDSYIVARYYDEESARLHVKIENSHWGTRAEVRRVDGLMISDDSPKDVESKIGKYLSKSELERIKNDSRYR